MGRAEELFERVTRGGEGAINTMIDDRQSEELYLDFKRSADDGGGTRLHQNDRQNLAKAISGFGNAEGGVIVWGVDCRNMHGAGDVAQAKIPIQNPRRFKSWLEGAISGCTVPAHRTVRHREIETATGSGFVATLIPLSFLAPHQCVHDLRYYMRAGSDFSPIPHAVLAGMFGRRPHAHLTHLWRVEDPRFDATRQPGDPAVTFIANLILLNRGPGIARDLYVNLETKAPVRVGAHIALNDWSQTRVSNESFSAISQEGARLGPNGSISLMGVTFQLDGRSQEPLVYTLSYGCADSTITYIEHTVPSDELQKIIRAKTVQEARQFAMSLLPREKT